MRDTLYYGFGGVSLLITFDTDGQHVLIRHDDDGIPIKLKIQETYELGHLLIKLAQLNKCELDDDSVQELLDDYDLLDNRED